MKRYTYYPSGTCSTQIDIELNDDVIENVTFTGGCNGNTQGISSLVRGMKVDEAVSRMQGIRCGYKNTSCPDQLATALREALSQAR